MMGPAPHTQLDAEIAGGMGMPDNGPKLMSLWSWNILVLSFVSSHLSEIAKLYSMQQMDHSAVRLWKEWSFCNVSFSDFIGSESNLFWSRLCLVSSRILYLQDPMPFYLYDMHIKAYELILKVWYIPFTQRAVTLKLIISVNVRHDLFMSHKTVRYAN